MSRIKVMFDPKTIALIGATERKGAVGRTVLENLLNSKERTVFPVNPGARRVLDVVSYPTIADVPGHVDLAVVATPARSVPLAVEECGRAGVEGLVIMSAGFGETGEEGARLEREIDRIRKKYGMRIMGPNCLGFVRPALGINATFLKGNPPSGNIAFISQSGALGSAILDWAVSAGIGFSMFASLGSMTDIDFGDMIDFLGDDPATRSILIYMEGVGNARSFMSAARAFASRKPIIALKPGHFAQSARAVQSHTGAAAGDDMAYEAVFRRAGVLRVGEIAELFDAARVLDSKRLPAGPRLAIVTAAAGLAVMAIDTLIRLGGEIAELSEESMNKLTALMPAYWNKTNPVDVLSDATVARFTNALTTCLEDPMVDGVLVIYVPMHSAPSTELALALTKGAMNSSKPVITTWMGGESVEGGRHVFVENGIPNYDTPEVAVRTYVNMYRYKRHLDQLYETPDELAAHKAPVKEHLKQVLKTAFKEGRTLLTKKESRDFLKTYHIPVSTAQIAHDSKAGRTAVALEKTGVAVDYELILGARKDKDFGSVILFGARGTMTEFIKDFSIGLPPLNQTLAKMLIQDSKAYEMLQGFHGKMAADLEGLEEILVSFSNLIVDFPEIASIDLNPLAVSNGKATARDARIIIDEYHRATRGSPYPHLIIAPYPTRYTTRWQLPDGPVVLLRAIRPEDEPAELEMLSSLSEDTLRTRFFSVIRDMSHEWLMLFCNIDYDRHMAIVAEMEENGKKSMIGVARLIMDQDLTSGEVAVLVQDRFQGKGLGTKLVKVLIGIARERGLENIRADVLTENRSMLKVFERLGFSTGEASEGTIEASLRLIEDDAPAE